MSEPSYNSKTGVLSLNWPPSVDDMVAAAPTLSGAHQKEAKMFRWFFGDNRAWRIAALEYMGNRLPDINRFDPDSASIERAIAKLANARRWVSNITDHTMRRHCERWCDHMDWQISEAKKELITGRRKKEEARLRREFDEEDNAVKRILSRFQ